MKKEEIHLYNILLHHIEDKYHYNELIKIFLKPEDYKVYCGDEIKHLSNLTDESCINCIDINLDNHSDINSIKQEIYIKLSKLTDNYPAWGIMTGVRPVKLTSELFEKNHNNEEKVRKILKDYYYINDEKCNLLIDTYKYQRKILGKAEDNSLGLYIGIPFCPTRCLYCSFTSNQKGPSDIKKYLECLLDEIRFAGQATIDNDMSIESVYIGGGTPTTLEAPQLDLLLNTIKDSFDLSKCKEFTVEAGRPDTITREKLDVIYKHGIRRISINPQTMNDETLKLIGRSHSVTDIRESFLLAKEFEEFIINADIIAGLPGENPDDFRKTLEEVISLNPENITVHTLAVKRASRLIETDESYHYKQAQVVEKMLEIAKDVLNLNNYRPYYLYRQKHMAGAMENVGYCKDDTACIYNIRIMDEHQSILALGAGGISKKYYPAENRLERVPNVSNYEIYIERLNEMIIRKKDNFFKEV